MTTPHCQCEATERPGRLNLVEALRTTSSDGAHKQIELNVYPYFRDNICRRSTVRGRRTLGEARRWQGAAVRLGPSQSRVVPKVPRTGRCIEQIKSLRSLYCSVARASALRISLSKAKTQALQRRLTSSKEFVKVLFETAPG